MARIKEELQECYGCGKRFPESKAQCPSCRSWNFAPSYNAKTDGTILLSDVNQQSVTRISTGPWDPCWGESPNKDGDIISGVVSNSVSLIGGKPGAGKSTLALQMGNNILTNIPDREVLYMAHEEAVETVRSRAIRLGLKNQSRIRVIPMGVKVDLGAVILARNPVAMIYDSLVKICPDPAAAVDFLARLKEYSMLINSPALVIDHVTKSDDMAGLMAAQHEVDMMCMFSVDEDDKVREIETLKNRHGADGIRVLLNMTENGLVYRNPEEDEDDEDDDD